LGYSAIKTIDSTSFDLRNERGDTLRIYDGDNTITVVVFKNPETGPVYHFPDN
jgi:hypothetical protein